VVPICRKCQCSSGGKCQCNEGERPAEHDTVARQRSVGGRGPGGPEGTRPGARPSGSFVQKTLQSAARPLDSRWRRETETAFGRDFGDVRIHVGGAAAHLARSVEAVAYTVGPHVVFGEGAYAPDTPKGWRTLVHELTHVVQQSGQSLPDPGSPGAEFGLSEPNDPLEREADRVASGLEPPSSRATSPGPYVIPGLRPVLRASGTFRVQKLDCNLGPVNDECAGAASQCMGVKDYCAAHYPNPADIDALHAKAVQGATGMAGELPNAAANLLHFLDGSGTEKVMGTDIFKNHSATKDKVDGEHLDKFKAGAEARLGDGRMKVGGPPVDMIWTGTANAFSLLHKDDLGLAVGGYTLCSKVTATAVPPASGAKDQAVVTLDPWTVQAFDCYNWDPGKGIGLPGADDNDLCCLENAGKGKHFLVRTDPWPHGSETFTTAVSANPPSSTPASPPAKPPDERR